MPATIPTNSASHDDRVVRLCFLDRQDIRLGHDRLSLLHDFFPPPGASDASVTIVMSDCEKWGCITRHHCQ
eukprot:12916706-Prorocentrum_lima.AAC.1